MSTEFVKQAISSNKLVIFSKTFCPYCVKAKQLFANLKVNAFVIELDNRGDCGECQDALKSITGVRSVPQIFVNQKFIGGCDGMSYSLSLSSYHLYLTFYSLLCIYLSIYLSIDTHKLHKDGKLVPLLKDAGLLD
ncbi:hypothetical protein DFA_02127 [Cavenderia fasciculata]|uniref:Glutaredoxin domain-containing protein n=1 Tax=Cavenderia fasciculata TaxID=261658 RepID=F4PYS4_CACFS|nr:uncharacterized protein DFA_02127 [Cavenderia fasciculata]EGG19340.1 hypothetical protein DFA_02127 [Cavenderia fasciculata]|eukprot:XP_004357611.1 hypothetical protein DFA_02127 [Cavenderia fasciculata]